MLLEFSKFDGYSEELYLISASIPVFPDAHRKSASEVMVSDHMALEQMWRSADTQAHWRNWHAGMFSHAHTKSIKCGNQGWNNRNLFITFFFLGVFQRCRVNLATAT